MKLNSPTFSDGEEIPSVYTCEGKQISPELHILDIPSSAKSLVLIMEDPDVPLGLRSDGMFDHWVVFNISADISVIKSGGKVGVEGLNTAGRMGYIGPCPPDKRHRYFFKLFAIDRMLELPSGCSKKDVLSAIYGHVVDKCELMGTYDKKNR